MPRLGFAFKVNDKTVLRMGYGIFFGFLGQRRGDVIQTGFTQNTPLNVSLDNGLTFIETLSNPFQNGILPAVGAPLARRPILAIASRSSTRTRCRPTCSGGNSAFSANWGKFVAEVSYIGNRGTHIEVASQHQCHAEPVPQHQPDEGPGADRLLVEAGAQSVCRVDAGDGKRNLQIGDHRAGKAASPVPAIRPGEHDDQ